MSIAEQVITDAKQLKEKIVFPESDDPRILEAVSILARRAICTPILLGNPERIRQRAGQERIHLGNALIVDHTTSPDLERFTQAYYQKRKEKGTSLAQAKKTMLDGVFYAAMMVKEGLAAGVVTGATHPTKKTLQAAIKIIGLERGRTTGSSMFFMEFPHETLIFADCGFVIEPSDIELADVAMETVKTAQDFGFTPLVAMLSFSTHGSASHEKVDKVVRATKIVKKKMPRLAIDGELQFDAAYVPEIQRSKAPKSPLRGKPANVFIFPELNSGNIGYKIAQRLGGAKAYGPILQGFRAPINDLSRGCDAEEIVVVAAITAVQAQHAKVKA